MIMETVSGLSELRKRAAEQFESQGYPTTRNEEWRFTNIAPIVKAQFPVAAPVVAGPSLKDALEADPELIEAHLGRYASTADNPFVALNTAQFEDGAFVQVPANTVLPEPIDIEFKALQGRTTHPRTLIVVGPNSQVQIIERYSGAGKYFTNAVTEIVVGENSIVEHIKLNEESREAFHVATIQARLGRNANFKQHNVTLGGALVRNDINAVLSTGSEGTVNGFYFANGKQHIDNHTAIDHAEAYAASHELYKGILDGHSTAVFNGKIYVRKDAQKTDAKQTNKNLVLSENASINTKPELQILADDVRCTHGATVGQLDQEALFYLQARGINKDEARNLLIYAFARDVIERMGVERIRQYLEKALFEVLTHKSFAESA
ncbi:MAG TPA: Fe-S cluster assembly protein SufD [Bryobacteraceae bacterium]|jgi:Fe-S cluster assembly protein SufD|nr:Fe-S cluster assembly protein SufD [Bryobacteraceae bacterium]